MAFGLLESHLPHLYNSGISARELKDGSIFCSADSAGFGILLPSWIAAELSLFKLSTVL